jgi:hypothetical protein
LPAGTKRRGLVVAATWISVILIVVSVVCIFVGNRGGHICPNTGLWSVVVVAIVGIVN